MASGCENVTARCEVICSPFWNILMLRRITMAAKGNCDPPQRTAKSRAASDPVGVPIYSPPFDPSLAPQHDGESMHIKLFALFYTGNRCYCRVEQIPFRDDPNCLRSQFMYFKWLCEKWIAEAFKPLAYPRVTRDEQHGNILI